MEFRFEGIPYDLLLELGGILERDAPYWIFFLQLNETVLQALVSYYPSHGSADRN